MVTPVRLFNKIVGKPIDYSLIGNVSIKNKFGRYNCGNNIWLVYTASSISEPNVSKFIDLEKGVFIDIGANIGKYTIKVANHIGKNGKVIAIEPEDFNFRLLKKNISLNLLNNVSTFKMGCYSKKMKLNLFIDENSYGTHSFVKKSKDYHVKSIPVDTLDNIVKSSKIDTVNLIKIDVEGAELDVLKGSVNILKRFHPKIIIEIWDDKRFNAVMNLLKQFGYDYQSIDKENYLFE